MSGIQHEQGRETRPANGKAKPGRARLIGIDAARGLALFAMVWAHILPPVDETTGHPILAWQMLNGHAAPLFTFLAGVGLALGSGGIRPHEGRRMAGDRLGLMVRALLIGVVSLVVSAFAPQNDDPPAYGILLYFSVLFLLAIPFLHLKARALFLAAAAFGIVSPFVLQNLSPVLPMWHSFNPTLGHIFSEPAGTVSQVLVTGSYPVLPYMSYLLVGMGIGRLDLGDRLVLLWIGVVGAGLAIASHVTSSLLLYSVGGGFDQMLDAGISADRVYDAIDWGVAIIPNTSVWWLTLATPHTLTTFSIASGVGLCMLVTAMFIAVGRKAGRLLVPLAALGSMTLTVYCAHLIALSFEVHYDEPVLWFFVQLVVALVFSMVWTRTLGQGPLERVIGGAAKNFRQIVDEQPAGGAAGNPGPKSP